MSRLFYLMLGGALAALTSCAADACPNATTSVSIPLSGTALVQMFDQSCNVLPGASFTATPLGSVVALTSTSSPGVTGDAAGLHFAANGGVAGTTGSLTLRFTPANVSMTLTYVIGAPITAVSAGTTTP